MRRILFALVVLAGLSLPAFAQSFDETVSYIQDRCVGQTVEYTVDAGTEYERTLSSTLLSFNANEGRSIEFREMIQSGLRRDYGVSMSDVVSIMNAGNVISIEARPDSAWGDFVDDTRGAYSETYISFYCRNPDRIVRALQHLVSFAGDDPFAD